MQNKYNFARAATVVAFCICASILSGCVTQNIDLSNVKQASPAKGAKLTHFKESGHSVYMVLDLIEVSPVSVDELMARANPGNRPVANLQVTSSEGVLATVVNLLNGGVIDRGLIVSLNKLTVEGDIVQP